jgi:hypothetical protein
MSLVPQPSETPPTALESFAQTLAIGNVSLANDVVMSSPQKIDFAGNISLKCNSGGAGSDVIIDAIPANTGPTLTQGVVVDTTTNKLYRQPITGGFTPNIQTGYLATGRAVGGGGDAVLLGSIPSYIVGKTYRLSMNYALFWNGGTPAAGDNIYFYLTGTPQASPSTTNVIATNTTMLTDVANAKSISGLGFGRSYYDSFSITFVANGSFTPTIFMASGLSTGASGTPLPVVIQGLDTTGGHPPCKFVWEQLN